MVNLYCLYYWILITLLSVIEVKKGHGGMSFGIKSKDNDKKTYTEIYNWSVFVCGEFGQCASAGFAGKPRTDRQDDEDYRPGDSETDY